MEETSKQKTGEIRIAEEVVLAIAGLAATEVKGVASLSGGLTHDQIARSDDRSLSKGLRVTINGNQVAVRVYLILDGTVSIPDVSAEVQEKVKGAVEAMTGKEVTEVQVMIAGVNL